MSDSRELRELVEQWAEHYETSARLGFTEASTSGVALVLRTILEQSDEEKP